jgi:BCD family chlorophyll transporter-like MFS transporter
VSRLLRLSLIQAAAGMTLVLLDGALNRILIVELHVSAVLVALMIGAPLVFAPLRALIGFRSDVHSSALGWRRTPYLVMGTMVQFGGLAIMPFFLLAMTSRTGPAATVGEAGALLSFLMAGVGLYATQTTGLALAADQAPPAERARVVGLMFVALFVGMMASALCFRFALQPYAPLRLVKVIQSAAVLVAVLNGAAIWRQEAFGGLARARTPLIPANAGTQIEGLGAEGLSAASLSAQAAYDLGPGLRGDERIGGKAPGFRQRFFAALAPVVGHPRARRTLVMLALGSAAFGLQEVLVEPYGGQVLHMTVAATTALTGLVGAGSLIGFWLCTRALARGVEPARLAAFGALAGVPAFAAVVLAAPLGARVLVEGGMAGVGFAAGLFGVAALNATLALAPAGNSGLALGVWGAAQALGAGLAVALGGALRVLISTLAAQGRLGEGLGSAEIGYLVLYHLAIVLLFAVPVAAGPLVGRARREISSTSTAAGDPRFSTPARA